MKNLINFDCQKCIPFIFIDYTNTISNSWKYVAQYFSYRYRIKHDFSIVNYVCQFILYFCIRKERKEKEGKRGKKYVYKFVGAVLKNSLWATRDLMKSRSVTRCFGRIDSSNGMYVHLYRFFSYISKHSAKF